MNNLETERLYLRSFEKTDGPALYDYLSDEEVVKYEPYKAFSMEEAEQEAIRRSGNPDFYAVCLKDDTLIGNVYFSKGAFDTWMIGYVFNRSFWGHGYASEGVQAVVQHAFTILDAHRITALCNPENTASWQLMERVGMRREGTLKKNVFFWKDEQGNPIWQDTYEYGLLKEEYRV
ncbi:GNAT family N-acetyltransferase [Enterococcus sp. BWM-S5]|uniref:GNAT family N-acetyltransferase n=1 Tax=Enterococcus larvae TaxID=2794352 RepID=A0ABS4CH25_9ENTE|nr:GNAT family N-acetyltransferase [Enterococcus larvae]MBP1045857.1 GNAT family N-acetyltransferase [Enterococcus larvae]